MKRNIFFLFLLSLTAGSICFSWITLAQPFPGGPSYSASFGPSTEGPISTAPADGTPDPLAAAASFSTDRFSTSSFSHGPNTSLLSLRGDQRMVARSDWPHEFILLLDDLQEHLVSRDEQEQFLTDLSWLDQAYRALSKNNKDSLNFLAKALIYKGLLNWRPKVIVGPNLYSANTAANIKQLITQENFSPLLVWFFSAIERDVRAYLQEQNRKTQAAAGMALAWYQAWLGGKASFELDFYAAARKTWHHLAEQLYLLAFFTVPNPEDRVAFKPSANLPLQNFAKAALVAAEAPTVPTNTTKIRKRISPALAAIWFATPDPNYTPPANLPQPVDDWNWRPPE